MAHDPLEAWLVDESDFPLYGDDSDVLAFAVRYAILAPSGHNTQPWLFDIAGSELALYADRSRGLPVVDPGDRELVISCGASLLNLRATLAHFGYSARVDAFPSRLDDDLLARVRVTRPSDEPEDPVRLLFAAIPSRRTNRLPYQDRPLPREVIDALDEAVLREGCWLHTIDGEGRGAVADLVAQGDRVQLADVRFRRELAAWLRGNRSHRSDGIRGYGLGYGHLKSSVGPLVLRTFDLGQGRAAADRDIAAGSPLLAVLGTPDDTPPAWLAAGQALERLLLTATTRGVSASFLNQPVEIPELRRDLSAVTGRRGVPQLLMRLGYGAPPAPSPRRPVDEVIGGVSTD